MGRFRPSPPDRSVVFSPAESEDAGGQEVAKSVSHSPPVPVKPAGGAYGNRSVQAPPQVSVLRSATRMQEVVCRPFPQRAHLADMPSRGIVVRGELLVHGKGCRVRKADQS